jgi:hypothetical protein
MFAVTLARVVTRLTAAIALAGLLAAVPWALVTFVGWPLPRQLPTSLGDLQRPLTMPVADEVVIGLLAVAAWILWAAFAISLTAEAAARLRGVRQGALLPRAAAPARPRPLPHGRSASRTTAAMCCGQAGTTSCGA